MKFLFFYSFLLFFHLSSISAQTLDEKNVQVKSKINITVGLGYPDLFNTGVGYQLDQFQFGVGAGFLPFWDTTLLAFSGDVYYHFGGISKLSSRRPWYGKVKLMYLTSTDENDSDYMLLSPRLGRDFNISRRIGIAIDAGLGFRLDKDENSISEFPESDSESLSLLPAFNLALFYRL